MKYPRRWEQVNQTLYRLKVHGGWLVVGPGGDATPAFVPDPRYEWELSDE